MGVKEKVYELGWDYDHSGDSDRDAFHLPFKDDNKVSTYFSNPVLYGEELLPKRIYFQANFNLIPKYDFPLTDIIIPVMSFKMLKTLEQVRQIEYKAVPITMIDDTYPSELFDENGNLNNEVPTIDNYVAVRISKLESYFDYEKSIYRPSRSNPKIPGCN